MSSKAVLSCSFSLCDFNFKDDDDEGNGGGGGNIMAYSGCFEDNSADRRTCGNELNSK